MKQAIVILTPVLALLAIVLTGYQAETTDTQTATYVPRPASPPVNQSTPTLAPTPTSTSISTPTSTPTPISAPIPTSTPKPKVQVIYAIPSDREYKASYEDVITGAILHIQDWYADQLDGNTFAIADPVPLICEVEEIAEYFEGKDGWSRTIDALQHCAPVEHYSEEYVWVIHIDVGHDCWDESEGELGQGGAGITILGDNDLKGLEDPTAHLTCPDYQPRGEYGWIGGIAHELGHALGLEHPKGCDAAYARVEEDPNAEWPEDQCDSDALMWWGYWSNYPQTYLTDDDVAILESSPFMAPRE